MGLLEYKEPNDAKYQQILIYVRKLACLCDGITLVFWKWRQSLVLNRQWLV